jgi:hypothetical protein
MKTHFLFPNKFKTLGWLLFVPSLVLFILKVLEVLPDDDGTSILNIKTFAIYNQDFVFDKTGYFQIITNNISDEIITICIIIGGLFVGFSKLKNEDEMISKIRYESLVWATYFNYAIFIFCTLFVFGMVYLNVLYFNIFTLLLFFIIRFHYMIYKLNKANQDDE